MRLEIVDLSNVLLKGKTIEVHEISYIDEYGFFYFNNELHYTIGTGYAWSVRDYLNGDLRGMNVEKLNLKIKLREYKINRILCS